MILFYLATNTLRGWSKCGMTFPGDPISIKFSCNFAFIYLISHEFYPNGTYSWWSYNALGCPTFPPRYVWLANGKFLVPGVGRLGFGNRDGMAEHGSRVDSTVLAVLSPSSRVFFTVGGDWGEDVHRVWCSFRPYLTFLWGLGWNHCHGDYNRF